jgi:glutaconate CoA-transferase, subunit A
VALEGFTHLTEGSVQLWGITGIQQEAVLAAGRSLVTVEEIVP